MWHYRYVEREISPRRKGAAIEIYFSRLVEEIFSLHKNLSCSNLTKEERQVVYFILEMTPRLSLKKLIKALGLWSRTEWTN